MLTGEPIRLAERKGPKPDAIGKQDGDRLGAGLGARIRILLVDDVVDARDMYAFYFKHVGVAVATAGDGQSALAAARAERPDIIVLDLAMPGMTGWDVIRELRADPRMRTIPILVLSGQQQRDSALRVGADAYCEKPCLPEKLFGEMMRVLYRGQ